MFWTYLRRELRRRMRQAVFIALGLALGIGLVITVTSAATGVQNAQAAVLHSLTFGSIPGWTANRYIAGEFLVLPRVIPPRVLFGTAKPEG
jgi:hypothetical protein